MDTVEHSAILFMLNKLGFPNLWITWINSILNSASTTILLNGSVGKFFKCKRGVRQGDPLSPLLFVIAAELLQIMLNTASSQGIIKAPNCHMENDFPIIQYADDTLIFVEATQRNIFCIKGLLNTYTNFTGLKINLAKSCLIPLNTEKVQAEILSKTFGCPLGELPLPYLGLPLGTRLPKFQEFGELLNRIENRLAATSFWLTTAGKLQIVNSVLTALPTYSMCMFQLPAKVVHRIDQARRACLWRGRTPEESMKPLVKWEHVYKPKEKGGLGVINIRAQNNALLLKMLDKFYNKRDIPWVNLIWQKYYNSGNVPHLQTSRGSAWWKSILKHIPNFLAIARPLVGNGITTSIWFDMWTDTPIHLMLGRLFTFAKHQGWSIQKFKTQDILGQPFFLPLSLEAETELAFLQHLLLQITIRENTNDNWNYIWGNGPYQAKKLYAYTFNHMIVHPAYKWIWKCQCAMKMKVFFWLLLKDRLNTKYLLQRKNLMQVGGDCLCTLCDEQSRETSHHLFVDCQFAKECWNKIGILWPVNEQLEEQVAMIKGNCRQKFIMEVILIGAWTIWLHRNSCIFRQQVPSVTNWWTNFKECLSLQSHRIKLEIISELLA
ncbi:hypothetical protein GUJ93_ZPchr0009g2396 [Zizania palustris]|uniref:Reverse transcriptase domain-containing protein n=1 Tax=Zizania palustris TaxID=103762 RepID=A0A8J5RQR3_ZIZPA|nr:hypothetical protein GUJ93_ZPchr0009g2396 [Zizania palustris]